DRVRNKGNLESGAGRGAALDGRWRVGQLLSEGSGVEFVRGQYRTLVFISERCVELLLHLQVTDRKAGGLSGLAKFSWRRSRVPRPCGGTRPARGMESRSGAGAEAWGAGNVHAAGCFTSGGPRGGIPRRARPPRGCGLGAGTR